MSVPRHFLCMVLAVAALGAAGCGGENAEPVTVYAAASLRDAFPAIDTSPRYNFAGSNQLQTQIERGAPADVFASASAKEPQALHAGGRCSPPVAFASNDRADRASRQPGQRHVARVPDERSTPAPGGRHEGRAGGGKYTRELLETAGADAILTRNTVSNEANVSSLTSKVALGSADAGFAYNTDARSAGDRVEVIRLPAELQPKIQYLLCAVRKSEAGQAFIDKVTSDAGRRVLERQGFGPPPGT